MPVERKLKLGVIFGGQSGEHEVSLMSARSVLAAIDPDHYEVVQIGITHEGAWLTGANVLDALRAGELNRLEPAALLPDPTQPGLRDAHWAEPMMVAAVSFTEWTDEGSVRHPSFQGLREDKSAREVKREIAASK